MSYSTEVQELHGKVVAKRTELKALHTVAKEKGLDDGQRDQIKALAAEVGDLNDKYGIAKGREDNDNELKALNEPVNRIETATRAQVKSIGESFLDSDEYK